MGRLFDVGSALFAFPAAIFWFASAAGTLVPMFPYPAPPTDRYRQAVEFSARMNTVAAACSGMSALLFALRGAFSP
jgi:hypothetical protein